MRTVVLTVMLATAIAMPIAVHAQTQLTVSPWISISSVSDDNIFATSTPSADHTTLVIPGVLATVKTARASLAGSYSFDMLRSADFSALNDLEARRHARLDASYRETSRLTFGFNGRYDRSDEAGELNFETAFLLPRTRATRWELAPSFTYKANPVITVYGQYDWLQESLEGFLVTEEQIGRLFVSRQLTERGSITAGYIGRQFTSDTFTETSQAVIAGPTYELGPFTMLTVQGGPRFSSRGGVAPEIIASLLRREPTIFGYAVDCWRGQSIILGVVGPVEVTSATGRAFWPLRHHIEIGAGTGYFKSDSLIQGQARTYHTAALASWTPKPFYTVTAAYGTDFQRGDIRTSLLNGQDVVRHVFQVSITVAPRLNRTLQPTGPIVPLIAPRGNQS